MLAQVFVFLPRVFATDCCWIQDGVLMDLHSVLAPGALYLWACFCSKEGLGWDFESSCELSGDGRGWGHRDGCSWGSA